MGSIDGLRRLFCWHKWEHAGSTEIGGDYISNHCLDGQPIMVRLGRRTIYVRGCRKCRRLEQYYPEKV